jgi:hypothetical protein
MDSGCGQLHKHHRVEDSTIQSSVDCKLDSEDDDRESQKIPHDNWRILLLDDTKRTNWVERACLTYCDCVGVGELFEKALKDLNKRCIGSRLPISGLGNDGGAFANSKILYFVTRKWTYRHRPRNSR